MLTVINTVLLAKGYSQAVQQILFGVIILVVALYSRTRRLRETGSDGQKRDPRRPHADLL